MNIFELSIITNPLAGAFAGGSVAGVAGAGAGAGFVIGLALYGAVVGLFILTIRKSFLSSSNKASGHKIGITLISIMQVAEILALCALPLASWELTRLVIEMVQHG
jgi:hypothetical protein